MRVNATLNREGPRAGRGKRTDGGSRGRSQEDAERRLKRKELDTGRPTQRLPNVGGRPTGDERGDRVRSPINESAE